MPLDILRAAQSRGQKGFAFEDAREGDWIKVGQMGAYSAVVSTDFNSLKLETFIAVDEPPFHL